jgi:hypothetical protein
MFGFSSKNDSLFSESEMTKINTVKEKCKIIKSVSKLMSNLSESLANIAELALNRINIEYELRTDFMKRRQNTKLYKNSNSRSGKHTKPETNTFGSVTDWNNSSSPPPPSKMSSVKETSKCSERKYRKNLIQHDLVTKVIQTSPVVDRLGRLLMDLSSHVALLSDGYDSVTRLNEFSNQMNGKEEFQGIFGSDSFGNRHKKETRRSGGRGADSHNPERVLRNRNNSLNQRTNQILGIRQRHSRLGIFDRVEYYSSQEMLARLWRPEDGRCVDLLNC